MITPNEAAKLALAPWADALKAPEADHLELALPPHALETAIGALKAAGWGYLAAITGLDLGVDNGSLEVLYQFCAGPVVLTLRVLIPREVAEVSSICANIPYAGVFERELSEMFGITVRGAPDATRLLLPDEWPLDIHPLRKDAAIALSQVSQVPQDSP